MLIIPLGNFDFAKWMDEIDFFVFCYRRKMTGMEYMLSEVMEPHLFVIRKQKRDSAEKVTPMLTYYVLDGSIYQAPQLCNVFSARIVSFFSLVVHDFPKISRTFVFWYLKF